VTKYLLWQCEKIKAHPEDSAFLAALLWKPEYDTQRTISKRSNFPSWSWVAYRGITGIQQGPQFWDAYESGIEVRIRDQSHRKLRIAEYLQEMGQKYDTYRYQPCILLTGWVTYMRFRCPDVPWNPMLSPGEPMTLIALDERLKNVVGNATIMTSLFEHTVSDMKTIFNQKWPVLLYVDKGPTRNLCGLILKPLGDGLYERLGTLDQHMSNDNWHEEYNPACASEERLAIFSQTYNPRKKSLSFTRARLQCKRRTIELR